AKSALVHEDGFAAGGCQRAYRAEADQIGRARAGVIGEQKDTLRSGPQLAERIVCFKDVRSVGPEAAEPRPVDAAVDQVDGLPSVKEQSGAGRHLAIDHNEVVRLGRRRCSVTMASARAFEPRV